MRNGWCYGLEIDAFDVVLSLEIDAVLGDKNGNAKLGS